MKNITKAVIPCGGRGTRFLPITKSVPKEVLPVIDEPVIGLIVKELEQSGIKDVLIILGQGKEAIRGYFSDSADLEAELSGSKLELLHRANTSVKVSFTYQNDPKGSGDAIMRAREFTGDEPFCVCNGDDLIVGEPPASLQLMQAYKKSGKQILGVQEVEESQTNKYGVIKPGKVSGRNIECLDIVEKPKSNAPSRYAALGRYVFTPEIYTAIEKVKPDASGEIQLTEAIKMLMKEGKVDAYDFVGRRHDMGDKLGAVIATVERALDSSEFGEEFFAYLQNVVESRKK